ncbi:hypothetical protein LOC68_01245 [Blastopirellula sp. JC732]|uniref:Uncharacterized protein n=1 Tax=Blastopirellula sediminis TaxID=2894196 RepID=A0A9X1MIS6_9BACT|nr:hypothetical protein [Blastopirellula sediminis]MCC9608187.1 hypothetical protein [Blastopirellula sediminis]MCC9627020.1 hypothetical protein [Blastopirellula sediminis]
MKAASPKKSPDFLSESAQILERLQQPLAGVMRALGGIKKSGDLERMLGLDRTLAWQLVKVAESTDPLENAANVPSRVSIERFVQGAQSLGVSSDLTTPLLAAHEQFESLVARHAGDRVCFNTMVSAAGKGEQWHAKELQHRRNVFRGMSHMLGVQAGLLLRSSFVRRLASDPDKVEAICIGGVSNLRLLRETERINIYQSRVFRQLEDGVSYHSNIERTNVYGNEEIDGYRLSDFCTSRDAQCEMIHGESGWIYGNLLNGAIGATGESSHYFGTRYYNIPHPAGREGQFATRLHIDLPVKVYIADEFIEPGFADDWIAQASAMVGSSASDRAAPPGIERTLPCRMDFECLGQGPPPAIKEFPDYPEMVRHVADHSGFDLSDYQCWRLRVEYPLYGSTIMSEFVEPRS